MSKVAQLKQKARAYEQREQWKSALELYEQMVQQQPEGEDPDVGVWNRIGDLNMRLAQPTPAVEAYERAVDAYSAAGLHNNAIALCTKVLRITPDRCQTYLKLGMISALKGFLADARQHLARYVELMSGRGQLDQALDTLRQGVATHPPDDTAVRRAVAEQLQAHGREAEALELLQAAHRLLVERGQSTEAERVRVQVLALGARDDELAVPGGTAPAGERARRRSLDDIQLGVIPQPGAAAASDEMGAADTSEHGSLLEAADAGRSGLDLSEILPMDGFESHSAGPDQDADPEAADFDEHGEPAPDNAVPEASLAGPAELEPRSTLDVDVDGDGDDAADADDAWTPGTSSLPLLEPGSEREPAALADTAGHDAAGADEAGDDDLAVVGFDPWADGDADEEGERAVDAEETLPALELTDWRGDARDAAAMPAAGESQQRDEQTVPSDAAAADDSTRSPAEALIERLAGDPAEFEVIDELTALVLEGTAGPEVIAALETAMRGLADRGAWREAIAVVRPLLALQPAPTALFQRQVELAHGADQPELLIRAYLDLADHLQAHGDPDKVRVVYERVIELDADNPTARAALGFPREPRRFEDEDAGYVDLAALIMEDEPDVATTRFVVEAEPPSGDEDRDFAEILNRFREQVARNISPDDSASHYDLGVAFKEMGLWDDAASEFQAALKAGAEPLAALEMLGECFVAQGQYAVGWRVLDRAVRLAGAADSDMLGVLYWIARCDEQLDRAAAAAERYERILAVDIRFRDAAERLRVVQSDGAMPML